MLMTERRTMTPRSGTLLTSGGRLLAGVIAGCTSMMVTHGALAASTITRTSAFDYDPATGLLVREIVEPDYSDLCVVTEYTLDDYGRRKADSTRNCNGTPADAITGTPAEAAAPGAGTDAVFALRATSVVYSTDQRFVVTSSNALPSPKTQSDTKTYDERFGAVASLKGPNQLTTTWAYDDYGRKILEQGADGNGTRWDYQYCSGYNSGTLACPTVGGAAAIYAITATPVTNVNVAARTWGAANGPYTRTYFDSLGREIRTETQGFDGGASGSQIVYVDTKRNSVGDVTDRSRPYYSSGSVVWVTFTYDTLHRVKTEQHNTAAGLATTYTDYSGLTTTFTDPLTHQTVETRNIAGLTATITDAKNGVLRFDYDAAGNKVKTTDQAGNVISNEYDLKGRKKATYDPDMGVWTYGYDALGQLKWQLDNKDRADASKKTTYSYDELGRIKTRVELGLTSNWLYDDAYSDNTSCTTAKGKLCEVNTDHGYTRRFAYDSLGRPQSSTTFAGSSYTGSVHYDGNGRVDLITYPLTGLQVRNGYTPLGYLQTVTELHGNVTVWTGNAFDAAGRPTTYTYGNTVQTTNTYFDDGRLNTSVAGTGNTVLNLLHVYDLAGNLNSHIDSATGITATYTYDELNRLRTETRSGASLPSSQTIGWDYDAIGNMTTRVEGGFTNVYNYNSSGSGSNLPHAVASVSGMVNNIAVPTYGYDANGNMLSGAGRTMTWTSYNMVQSITKGGTTLSYLYDADHQRIQETYTQSGATQRTTVYINPAAGQGLFFEEESGAAGLVRKHYVSAGGQVVAVITNVNGVGGTWSTQYWHQNHLGSNSTITNESGGVIERLEFEPFGKRRNANGLTDTSGTLVAASTDRGYTGHEHLDEVGLVNMNGRVYDPALGRFMSADPGVPYPSDLQSYNRYSYGENNPLSTLDPSGFDNWGAYPEVDVPVNWYINGNSSLQVQYLYNSYTGALVGTNLAVLVDPTSTVGPATYLTPLPGQDYLASGDTGSPDKPGAMLNTLNNLVSNARDLKGFDQLNSGQLASLCSAGFACGDGLYKAAAEGKYSGAILDDVLKDTFKLSSSWAIGGLGGRLAFEFGFDLLVTGAARLPYLGPTGVLAESSGVAAEISSGGTMGAAVGGGAAAEGVYASTPVGRTGSWWDTSQFTGNTVRANRELNIAGAEDRAVNAPATISGREYSGHALDRMQQRGYVPSVIEDAISSGTRTPSYGGASSYYSLTNNVTVIVNDITGRVVTVRGGP